MSIIKNIARKSVFTELDLLWFQTWEPELFYIIVKQYSKRFQHAYAEKYKDDEHFWEWHDAEDIMRGVLIEDAGLSGLYFFDEEFFC